MSEVDDFLHATIPRQLAAERALHDGDAGPRMAMWSHDDPVTVVGAWFADSTWDGVSGVFERVAAISPTPSGTSLRVSNLYRLENGWKLVHRHADPVVDQETSLGSS